MDRVTLVLVLAILAVLGFAIWALMSGWMPFPTQRAVGRHGLRLFGSLLLLASARSAAFS